MAIKWLHEKCLSYAQTLVNTFFLFENSKCLLFASVQMKHIVQKRPFCSHSKQNEKNESYLTKWHTKGFQNIKLVSLHLKSVNRENSKCLHFASVQMKHIVQKGHFFSFQTE